MTSFALFATAMLAPVAVALVVSAVLRRRRDERVGWWRTIGAVWAVLFLAGASLAIAGWALPDELDRLPADERRAVAPALAASPECGGLPFARVLRLEIQDEPGRRHLVRYTCGLTHFGLFRFANEADCVEGSWRGAGFLEPWSAGSCRPPIGDPEERDP